MFFVQNINKSVLLLIRIGRFNTVFFSDEDFSPCAANNRPLQDNENIDKFLAVLFLCFKIEYTGSYKQPVIDIRDR
jgi:hypothetical protein